ncbi:MAG: ABC-2 family transporter protein [Candidatus Wallbacteria bacterium]|nr:ABC-2 family transporter protein [Candidatus Wallbacteria bacterium]
MNGSLRPPRTWWRTHADLFVGHMRVNLARYTAYPVAMAFEQLSYLFPLIISILLWRHLFTKLPRFAGWSFDAVLVLHLFGNLFLALFHALFMGFHTFAGAIRCGRIDMWLTRPVDPRIAQIASMLRPDELLNRLLGLVPLVLYMAHRGVRVEPARLAAGLGAMVLGLVAFAVIQLTCACGAFWIARGDAILSFLDMFYGFYRFPLNTLPLAAQLVLGLMAPVLLAVTYPALFATGGADYPTLARVCLASVALIVGWWWLHQRIYRMGLKAYQSPGG